MRLLDLFAGPGGAAVGYARAGFDVVGVDLEPWACYPFTCHQADALEYASQHGHEFDAIHASPPCQSYSNIGHVFDSSGFPELLIPTMETLNEIGKPYVIENVPGAGRDIGFDVMLCGSMFPGLTVRRHRYFRFGHWDGPMMAPHGCNHAVTNTPSLYGAHWGRALDPNGRKARRKYLDALGMDWIPEQAHVGRRLGGMIEAFPPQYAEWIGGRLRTSLGDVPGQSDAKHTYPVQRRLWDAWGDLVGLEKSAKLAPGEPRHRLPVRTDSG